MGTEMTGKCYLLKNPNTAPIVVFWFVTLNVQVPYCQCVANLKHWRKEIGFGYDLFIIILSEHDFCCKIIFPDLHI